MHERLHAADGLYVLQTRYAQNNFQGSSRWILVAPDKKTLNGAVGKDGFPRALELLVRASGGAGLAPIDGVQSLIERGLLQATAPRSEDSSFLERYHRFVCDYPFSDYSQPNHWAKDREQMALYGKESPPPPPYTDLKSYVGKRWDLPVPEFRRLSHGAPPSISPMTAVATALAGTLQATGSIDGGDFGPWLRKACPSGGARHPTEVRLSIRGLPEIEDGMWLYDAQRHQLLYEKALFAGATEKGGSICWNFVSRVERPMWRYRDARSLRPVIIDAGHVVHSVRMFLSTMGFGLSSTTVSDNDIEDFDFDAPTLARFWMVGAGLRSRGHVRGGARRRMEELEYCRDQAYSCNPLLWLSVGGGSLWGHCEYPVSSKMELQKEDFLVLNYCIPSRRGDRLSQAKHVSRALGVDAEARMKALLGARLLVRSEEGLRLDRAIGKWCRYGWYQSLLACAHIHNAEVGGEAATTEIAAGHDGFSHSCYTLSDLRRITATERRTTRSFECEPLTQPLVDVVIDSLLRFPQVLSGRVGVRLCRFQDDNGQLWHLSGDSSLRLTKVDHQISRTEVVSNCMGQAPLQMADTAIWLHAEAPPKHAGRYVARLLDFGAIAQELCVRCADKGIGVFLSAAVRDRQTQDMLCLPANKDFLLYVIGIGLPAPKRPRPNAKRITLYEKFVRRNKYYVEIGKTGTGLIIDENGCVSRGR